MYLEPFARSPATRVPRRALEAAAAGQPRLGIPAARDFIRDTRPNGLVRNGTVKLLIIPALFADSPDPPVSGDELQQIVFDGTSGRGTLTDYYEEVSGGRLHVEGTVLPWTRTGITIAEAAGSLNGHGYVGPRMGDYVRAALAHADSVLDFGEFDDDGPDGVPNSGDDNGFVDAVTIEFAEAAGNCGGPGPWPHTGAALGLNGGAYTTNDRRPDGSPIFVPIYFTSSVVDCSGVQPDGIAVRAHELGHVLGLPDLYVTAEGLEADKRVWAVGCFDLMAAGGWGCGNGTPPPTFGPAGLSPLMKQRLGWLDFIQVDSADQQEFVLPPVATSEQALRVPLTPGGSESFIIEYRTRTGFDAVLPAAGVLIYDQDTLASALTAPPGLPPALPYHLVEADGEFALRRVDGDGGDRGDAADVFARNGDIAVLDDTTLPSTRDHLGATSTLVIHSIRVEDGAAHIVLSVGRGYRIASADFPDVVPAANPLTGFVRVAGGSAPYTATLVAGALPEGLSLTSDPNGARIEGAPEALGDFTFGVVVQDAAGRRTGTTLRLRIVDPDLATSLLTAGLADTSALPAATTAFLDHEGNRNGRYDVGDMRAYLIRTGRLGGG